MSAPPAARPPSLARPAGSDLALLTVGVLGVSTSGPLIAATVAPALAIAFWRNALATAVMLPYALLRGRADLGGLRGRELRLTLAAGALLAAHFATWVPSLGYTSVASSTALVCMQAVWAALFARLAGERLPARAWLGMALALLGVLLVTGVDATLSPRTLVGDVLALVGGIFSGAYVVLGAQVRRRVSTTAYTTVCYATCALLLLAACALSGQALSGYPGGAWVRILALTVLAQLLGHSVFNLVLRTTSPTVVSVAILFEVPGAALIAALALRQQPPLAALPALALLLAGIAVVVRSREQPRVVPVE